MSSHALRLALDLIRDQQAVAVQGLKPGASCGRTLDRLLHLLDGRRWREVQRAAELEGVQAAPLGPHEEAEIDALERMVDLHGDEAAADTARSMH
jgi:hypothetical protein